MLRTEAALPQLLMNLACCIQRLVLSDWGCPEQKHRKTKADCGSDGEEVKRQAKRCKGQHKINQI